MVRENKKVAGKLSYDNPVPRFIAAGALAIVLHMAFILFAQASDPDAGKIENPKYVTLLPLDTKVPSEKSLLQWMEIMDPTGVVKPDRKNGFSLTPGDPMPPDEPIALKPHYTELKKGSFLPLSPPVEKRKENVRRFWSFAAAGINAAPYKIPRPVKKDFPVWMKEDGSPLPQLFRNLEQVKKILAKEEKTLVETVVKWETNEPGFFPRVRLDSSCGNPELDKLAVKTLSIRGRGALKHIKNQVEASFIVIKWQE